MNVHYFRITMSSDEWMRYYRGSADAVLVRDMNGLKISIPARHFRPFTTYSGVQGLFRLILDENHKFISLERLRP